MLSTELLVLNLEEVRRRSLKVWRSIPADRMDWKPDAEAMTCIELVRHVPECEHLYLYMLKSGGSRPSADSSPWTARPYTSVEAEIEFAEPYRKELLNLIGSYTPEELMTKKIVRPDTDFNRAIGDFILRIAYHESVHTGQLLAYLREMNAPRPNIWD